MNRALGMLGLCARAGKLVTGEKAVVQLIRAGGACAVLLDGGEEYAACTAMVGVHHGDRVMCHIVNHRIVVFANVTAPTGAAARPPRPARAEEAASDPGETTSMPRVWLRARPNSMSPTSSVTEPSGHFTAQTGSGASKRVQWKRSGTAALVPYMKNGMDCGICQIPEGIMAETNRSAPVKSR